jgi:hypothetical protein
MTVISYVDNNLGTQYKSFHSVTGGCPGAHAPFASALPHFVLSFRPSGHGIFTEEVNFP